MPTIPDWMIRSGEGLTAADYEALSEEVCRRVEIVDGGVVVRPGPPRTHQHIAHNLTTAFEEATPPGFAAVGGVDLRLRDVPLLNRRPDVVVHKADLLDHEVLHPEHCLLVVEIMSPGSITTDQLDKPGEYAASGIRHFWRVEYDEAVSVFRYQFDPTTRTYALVALDKDRLSTKDPIVLDLDLEGLR